MRLHTLPLCFLCVGIGATLASKKSPIPLYLLALAFLMGCALQVLSNLANDLNDYLYGADNMLRTGPPRTVQSQKISTTEMKKAIWYTAILALLAAAILFYMPFHNHLFTFFFLFFLSVLSVAAAIFYTAPPLRYGYKGWGDLFVFLFFGMEAVLGTYFLFTQSLSVDILIPAVATGLLSVSILNLNNMRDIPADKKANKQSIPVRLGVRGALYYEWMLWILGVGCLYVDLWKHNNNYYWVLLPPTLFLLRTHLQITKKTKTHTPPIYFKQNIVGIFLMLCGYILTQLL